MRSTVPQLFVTDLGRMLLSSGLFLILSSCVPIPWFPENPYPDETTSFLSAKDVGRGDVVSKLGQPWANLNVESFVYIASKKSAYILIYNSGAAGVNRDYFLVIDFDDQGFVSKFETFADSLRHNYCFENGICMESRTFNVPVAPTRLDKEAKLFIPEPGKCVLYIFRDREGIGMAENGYADISYRSSNSSHPFRRLLTSVEYGYSRLEFSPSETLEFRVEMQPPKYGGADDLSDNDPDGEWKDPVYRSLACRSGMLEFLRLYVPEKNERKIEFHSVEPAVAKHKILGMKLLLERREFLAEELQQGRLIQ